MQSERERVIAELMEAFVSYSGIEKQIAEAAYDRGYKAGAENATKTAYDIGREEGRKAGIEAAAPERDAWVSVKERLPEKSDIKWRSTRVLGVIGKVGQHVRELEYKEHESDGQWYFFRGEWPYTDEDITHWRPLPNPPN